MYSEMGHKTASVDFDEVIDTGNMAARRKKIGQRLGRLGFRRICDTVLDRIMLC